MISVQIDTVTVSFLVDHLFSLDNARGATTVARGPSEVVEKQESDDGDDSIEEIWV